MQVDDVRGMLLLPRVETEPGMSFAATAIMLNLLCAFALWFDKDQDRARQRRQPRQLPSVLPNALPKRENPWSRLA